MALFKLQLPKMGESISEATLTKWLKQPGDFISEEEAVLEIATDKVDSDVPSPVKGILKEQLIKENQIAQVGDIIAIIETQTDLGTAPTEPQEREQEIPQVAAPSNNIAPSNDAAPIISDLSPLVEASFNEHNIPGIHLIADNIEQQADPVAHSESRTTLTNAFRFYSPLVKSIAQEESLSQQELDAIAGSGADGRVTKDDLLNYIKSRNSTGPTASAMTVKEAPIQSVGHQQASPQVAAPAAQKVYASNGDEIIQMDRMRKLIADHMIKSVQTSPHVCSFVEADVTNLVNWRNKIKDSYKKREGENMTFTPLFIEAIAKALRDFPMINIMVDGDRIIKRKNINIGMAAALPSGNLIVPVIKHADQLSLVGLSKAVNDLANRSRANKLKPDDTQDGTFTFTNIGAFGNIMGTPIINQPQVAILAVGTITKKPAVIETEQGDLIGIRHMMYLSLSYDHRVVDGALGGTFLKRVADYLEKWDSNREV